jgi:hypothetical protein
MVAVNPLAFEHEEKDVLNKLVFETLTPNIR